ncbi:aldehyde dehydrogenase family protein [Gryllotalpicola ginsengisoli]|uniref:aldehyde dehydrogenase family protein n=1 Tax=Gryllotalpicola ginsengisoli TaxID=444608 RepID=UPI000483E01C|nr:aldehyde dehydrogenase family protein [Gryllotalpicola ginsengisoli]
MTSTAEAGAGAAASVAATVAALRQTYDTGRTKPLAWRLAQLKALRRLLTENGAAIEDALWSDLHKAPAETHFMETGFTVAEIDAISAKLRRWLRPRPVPTPPALLPARSRVVLEPLGVVAVIAPWNYPVQLLLGPAAGALAAGNAVVLKPSELAPATSAVLAELVPRYLDRDAVAVVEGGVPETTALLGQRLDHIFYTGNGTVGKIVMEAAAKHLTPVTLELGGKSPTYVDDTVDLDAAASRIAWGRFVNAGQTCVAPDYVLATAAVQAELGPAVARWIKRYFGADPQASPDYGRIVNDRHFQRLRGLLGAGTTVAGGQADAAERYLAPTVLADVPREAPVMQEEIFGPILPFVTVDGLDDAIRFINTHDKPLALYVFTEDARTKRRFLTETSSGAVGFGIPLAHLSVHSLPFGGVGASGMGAYHGHRSVTTFSHEKAVISKPLKPDTMRLVAPPYTPARQKLIRRWLGRIS